MPFVVSAAPVTRRATLVSLCGLVLLGLSLPGCGLFGPKSNSQPDYVGTWLDENREVPAGRGTIRVDFYLALTEDRATKWQITQEGETECNTAGADVLKYDARNHKLVVAPDSGEARIKHYFERRGDQIVFSERYIFYALGRSDTLDLTNQDPAELEACQGNS